MGHYYDCLVCGEENGPGGCKCSRDARKDTKMDLVKKWKMLARQDDLFDHMVPSDVRVLIQEIERLQKIEKEHINLMHDVGNKNLLIFETRWPED